MSVGYMAAILVQPAWFESARSFPTSNVFMKDVPVKCCEPASFIGHSAAKTAQDHKWRGTALVIDVDPLTLM